MDNALNTLGCDFQWVQGGQGSNREGGREKSQWHRAQKTHIGLTVTDMAGWDREGPGKQVWAEAAPTHQARALEAWVGTG